MCNTCSYTMFAHNIHDKHSLFVIIQNQSRVNMPHDKENMPVHDNDKERVGSWWLSKNEELAYSWWWMRMKNLRILDDMIWDYNHCGGVGNCGLHRDAMNIMLRVLWEDDDEGDAAPILDPRSTILGPSDEPNGYSWEHKFKPPWGPVTTMLRGFGRWILGVCYE